MKVRASAYLGIHSTSKDSCSSSIQGVPLLSQGEKAILTTPPELVWFLTKWKIQKKYRSDQFPQLFDFFLYRLMGKTVYLRSFLQIQLWHSKWNSWKLSDQAWHLLPLLPLNRNREGALHMYLTWSLILTIHFTLSPCSVQYCFCCLFFF